MTSFEAGSIGTPPEIRQTDFKLEPDEREIEVLGPAVVELPGGFGMPDGTMATTAVVRELNGYDEEELSRADIKKRVEYMTSLLMRGVKSIGGVPMTTQMLDQLLLGDRDTLVIGVREATYGKELHYDDLVCPVCDEPFEAFASLDEIPIKKLEGDREFEVPLLRGGSKALVRLPTHGDQVDMQSVSLRIPDQNTRLLSRCVLRIGAVDVLADADDPETLMKRLSIRDRAAIISEMVKRQPGPDLQGVKVECPNCSHKDSLNLDLIGMFRL